MIKRRQFITGLGSVAAWPVVARAQQSPVPVVGFVHTGWADASVVAVFRKGLGFTVPQSILLRADEVIE